MERMVDSQGAALTVANEADKLERFIAYSFKMIAMCGIISRGASWQKIVRAQQR
jgi:hypothetical protein